MSDAANRDVRENRTSGKVATSSAPGLCEVPSVSADRTYTLYDIDDNPVQFTPGTKAPKYYKLMVQCNNGYSLDNANGNFESYCTKNGNWNLPIKNCLSKYILPYGKQVAACKFIFALHLCNALAHFVCSVPSPDYRVFGIIQSTYDTKLPWRTRTHKKYFLIRIIKIAYLYTPIWILP